MNTVLHEISLSSCYGKRTYYEKSALCPNKAYSRLSDDAAMILTCTNTP